MYTVTFIGFETPEQAKAFAEWYLGLGEQDSALWLEEAVGIKAANVDLITDAPENNINVHLKIYHDE